MANNAGPARPPARKFSWHDPAVRGLLYQALAIGAVVFVVWYLASNTVANLNARKIATGFAFMNREAGFAIGENLISYGPADTYLRALVVGLLNTLRVAAAGICSQPFWAR